MSEHPQRSGILLVDKAGGLTSHDVVSRVRKLAGTKKVGHAGTLDPLATGLLVLGINSSTRLLTYLVGLDKEYLATIRLGASTPTDDAESVTDCVADPARLAAVTDEDITVQIASLTGIIEQVPSAVSAIKVDGKRAYARVRAGEEVELAPRVVTVSTFTVLEVRRGEWVDVDVLVRCSSGTYVRALARDLGSGLGVGGHLTALRRTQVGPFGVAGAHALSDLDVSLALHSPESIARQLFPVLSMNAQQALELSQGKRPAVTAPDCAQVAAITPAGTLAGLVSVSDGIARVLVNFPEDEVS